MLLQPVVLVMTHNHDIAPLSPGLWQPVRDERRRSVISDSIQLGLGDSFQVVLDALPTYCITCPWPCEVMSRQVQIQVAN